MKVWRLQYGPGLTPAHVEPSQMVRVMVIKMVMEMVMEMILVMVMVMVMEMILVMVMVMLGAASHLLGFGLVSH